MPAREAERGGPAGGVAFVEPAVREAGDEPAARAGTQTRARLLGEEVEGDGDGGALDGEPVGLADRSVDGERDESAPRPAAHGHLGDCGVGLRAILAVLGAVVLLPGREDGLAAGVVQREVDEPVRMVLQHDRVADEA